MKLLIVDDERQIREGLKETIDWHSIGISDVYTAKNGFQALEIAKEITPEITLTDIRMPQMDGLELSQHLKELSPKMHILLLSGYSDFEYARQGILIGVENYLTKPVNIDELLNTVEKIVQKSKLKRSSNINSSILPNNNNALIQMAKRYIDTNFDKNISVQDVADYIERNPNYFCHIFRKETGTSFSEYLNTLRVEESKRLLISTSYMAYEIADKVGFGNYKYFYQCFKKMVGETPTQYKNNHYPKE